MQSDSHTQREQTMEFLALRIRHDVSQSGMCELQAPDLELIWQNDHTLSNEQKRLRLKDFALRYGFYVVVDSAASRAAFQISN